MGATPGKKSRCGREVIARMRAEGRVQGNRFRCRYSDRWFPISEADMGHIDAAVRWWNRKGYKYGAKAPEVRAWMLNSDNYELEHYRPNRSHGALMRAQGIRYRKPRARIIKF